MPASLESYDVSVPNAASPHALEGSRKGEDATERQVRPEAPAGARGRSSIRKQTTSDDRFRRLTDTLYRSFLFYIIRFT